MRQLAHLLSISSYKEELLSRDFCDVFPLSRTESGNNSLHSINIFIEQLILRYKRTENPSLRFPRVVHINLKCGMWHLPVAGEGVFEFQFWSCERRKVFLWGKTDPNIFLEVKNTLFSKDPSQGRKNTKILTEIRSFISFKNFCNELVLQDKNY